MKYINWVFIICVNIWSLLLGFLFPVEAGLVFCQNEFLSILLLKIQVLWDVTLQCWASSLRCVEMLCCFIFKGNQPMMVILCGLIALEEEDSVVSEWFPVSILNDCVCGFHLPDSKKRETQSSEMLGANDPKTQHRFPEDTNLQHWYLSWHVQRNTLNSSNCCSSLEGCLISS